MEVIAALLTPVTPDLPGRTPSAQAAAWKAYIAWERSNSQRLDGPALAARVSLAYEQALMPLYHHPEVSPVALSFLWQRAKSMFPCKASCTHMLRF